jgi:hypothetical protein
MDENYCSEHYNVISIFNIKEKVKHYILNDYYDKLVKHLLKNGLITQENVDKINADFYIYVNET